eukprot:g8239.t1
MPSLSELVPNPPALFDVKRIGNQLSRSGLQENADILCHLLRQHEKDTGVEIADWARRPWVDRGIRAKLTPTHRELLGREAQLSVVHEILHPSECAELIILAESVGFERVAFPAHALFAPGIGRIGIFTGAKQFARQAARPTKRLLIMKRAAEQRLRDFAAPLESSGLRRHSRFMFCCEDLAASLLQRLVEGFLVDHEVEEGHFLQPPAPSLPDHDWKLFRLNPRMMSIMKYEGAARDPANPGSSAERFDIHRDGVVRLKTKVRFLDHGAAERPEEAVEVEEVVDEQSFFTVLVYLNSLPPDAGGGTRFCARPYKRTEEHDLIVEPETGKVLMFEHGLQHAGEPLLTGGAAESESTKSKSKQVPLPSCKLVPGEHHNKHSFKKKLWLLKHICPVEDRLGILPENDQESAILGYRVVRTPPA